MAQPEQALGGCHCGAIRFRVRVRERVVIECDCSMCRMRANLHLIVPPADFELLAGAEHLTTYRFGTHTAVHRFCKRCGVQAFYTPRSHPDQVDVNARCLDPGGPAFRVERFAGSRFESEIHRIR